MLKIKFVSGSDDNASKGSSAKAQTQMQKGYSFDSSALERAADAARQLERSRNAKEAFEIARLQEYTKQKEYEAAAKVYLKSNILKSLQRKRYEYLDLKDFMSL